MPCPQATGTAYLEVQGVPADLVDVGQGAAVVRTLTAGQTEVLGLELQKAGQRPRLPTVTPSISTIHTLTHTCTAHT